VSRLVVPLMALISGVACAELPTVRVAPASPPSTLYSPGDGLVMVFVTTTTTATISVRPASPDASLPVQLTLRNVDLDATLVTYVDGGALLVEPGRYHLLRVAVGHHTAALRSEVFTVRSGRRTVLPDLEVSGSKDSLQLGFKGASRFTDERFDALFPGSPWAGRPRLEVAWDARPPEPMTPMFVDPGAQRGRSYASPRPAHVWSGGDSPPPQPVRSPR
jgi:hypothetical protein